MNQYLKNPYLILSVAVIAIGLGLGLWYSPVSEVDTDINTDSANTSAEDAIETIDSSEEKTESPIQIDESVLTDADTPGWKHYESADGFSLEFPEAWLETDGSDQITINKDRLRIHRFTSDYSQLEENEMISLSVTSLPFEPNIADTSSLKTFMNSIGRGVLPRVSDSELTVSAREAYEVASYLDIDDSQAVSSGIEVPIHATSYAILTSDSSEVVEIVGTIHTFGSPDTFYLSLNDIIASVHIP